MLPCNVEAKRGSLTFCTEIMSGEVFRIDLISLLSTIDKFDEANENSRVNLSTQRNLFFSIKALDREIFSLPSPNAKLFLTKTTSASKFSLSSRFTFLYCSFNWRSFDVLLIHQC